MIREPEFVSGGQPEGSCSLRISGALVMRSNSAIRATGVEYSRRFLRELDCYNLAKRLSRAQEISHD